MIGPLSIFGIFCEDIREEKSGLDTLIGVFQDRVNVRLPDGAPETAVGVINKLCLYVRARFPVSLELPAIPLRLNLADGQILQIGSFEKELITKARAEAIERASPSCGLILKGILSPVPAKVGRFDAIATVEGEDFVFATLEVKREQPAK